VVFGGSYGIGADVCKVGRSYGAQVFSFSRSQTGTHVEHAPDVAAALREAHDATGRIDFVVNTAGVLQRGNLADIQPAAIEKTIRVNYLAPVVIAQAAMSYLGATQGHLLLYTSSSYTRGRVNPGLRRRGLVRKPKPHAKCMVTRTTGRRARAGPASPRAAVAVTARIPAR
jgi:NAD(P)-dependent dehydrogenase (short-subunit alcohol dehydrogenase family)